MASIGVIARRLADGHVQYGYGGMSAYYSVLGSRLLEWYDSPDMVEYLFGLGELQFLGAPESEKGGYSFMMTTKRCGTQHCQGTTERNMFSQIAFVDHGYFYDTDSRWYYIVPGPFRIKMPLSLLQYHLDDSGYEFDFVRKTERGLLAYIFGDYLAGDEKLAGLLEARGLKPTSLLEALYKEEWPVYALFDKQDEVFRYFDDWVIVLTDQGGRDVAGYKVRPKKERHVETIEW